MVAVATSTLAAKKKMSFRNLSDFMLVPPDRRHSARTRKPAAHSSALRNECLGTASLLLIGSGAIHFKQQSQRAWKPRAGRPRIAWRDQGTCRIRVV